MTEEITLNEARKEKGIRPIPIGDKILIERGTILKPTPNDLRIAAGMEPLDNEADIIFLDEESVPETSYFKELLGESFFQKFFTEV